MNDFIFHNPCKVYFGKNQLHHLPEELSKYGKRVLLVYGGGSIKRNGLYKQITDLLDSNSIYYTELSGVEPNPRIATVNKGAEICRNEKIDLVIAIGGGSVIDCTKAIACAAASGLTDFWPVVKTGRYDGTPLPIIAILTIAATGSEMDPWAVISNPDTNEKVVFTGEILPKAAFENPEHTFSLPAFQTACGSFDILNHALDDYYFAGKDTFELTKQFEESLMRTVVKYAPIALSEPDNYEARANLMWASSIALNEFLDAGTHHKAVCHAMEHELSAYYDITHGLGLAILTPRWIKYMINEETAPDICRLGENVFGVKDYTDPIDGANKTAQAISDFCFKTLGLTSTLTELGIDSTYFRAMAEHACPNGKLPGLVELTPDDIVNIYTMCL